VPPDRRIGVVAGVAIAVAWLGCEPFAAELPAGPADAAPAASIDAGTPGDGDPPARGSKEDGAAADVDAGADAGSDGGPPRPSERVVFTTKGVVSGAIGGIAGADALCMKAVRNSSHALVQGRTFIAYLSGANDPVGARLVKDDRPFVRPDGKVIAASWNAFFGATHGAPIDVDEHGGTIADTFRAWTGSNAKAEFAFAGGTSTTCDGWKTTNTNAVAGDPQDADPQRWANAGNHACTATAHLYCIEP
jgi:hypothetical protein